MNTCPCCGQRVAQNLPMVDIERRIATIGGRQMRMSDLEVMLLRKLVEVWPRVVSRRQLMIALYGKTAENDPQNKLAAVVGRLSRRMSDRSWRIKSIPRVGVTLERPPEFVGDPFDALQGRGPEVSHV